MTEAKKAPKKSTVKKKTAPKKKAARKVMSPPKKGKIPANEIKKAIKKVAASKKKAAVKKKAAPKKKAAKKAAPKVLQPAKTGKVSRADAVAAVKKVETPKKKKAPKKPAAPKKKRVKNYLNNKDIMKAVIASKEKGEMSNLLAHMLQTLTMRYGRKGNYAGYSYNEDMQAYAMMMLVHTWNNFKPERSNNPFAFYTQCIKNSFNQFLNKEKRHRMVRDEMLLCNGLNPSYSYQLEHEKKYHKNHGEGAEHPEEAITVEPPAKTNLLEF